MYIYLIDSFSSHWVFRPLGSCNILLKLLDWSHSFQNDFQVHNLMKAHRRFWENWKNLLPNRMWRRSRVGCWLTWRMLIHMVRYMANSDSLQMQSVPVCYFFYLKFLLHVFRCWWNEIPSLVKCSKSFSRSRIMGTLYSLWQVCSVVLMRKFRLFHTCSKNSSLSAEVRWLWSEVFVKHIRDSKNTC